MKLIYTKILCLFCAILFLNCHANAFEKNHHRITDYHQVFFLGYNANGDTRVVIRAYHFDNALYYLAVDPENFSTEAAPAENFKIRRDSNLIELSQTPYIKALTKYTSPPYKLENYGITHAEHSVDGVFLTVDMCPSKKLFETDFFNTLVNLAKKTHHAMPVALSISGLWITHHPDEFNWLIEQEQQHTLKITWVNHTYNHAYYPDIPLDQNFLLLPETNMPFEILATEKLLLEHGQLPSVFFRFPGLISNDELVLQLRKFGLIPIGSNAWLAKDQTVKNGSFILVHGNSNEHEGIVKLMPLLLYSNYHWLPLNAGFD